MQIKKAEQKLFKLKNISTDEVKIFKIREHAVEAGRGIMKNGQHAVLSTIEQENEE